MRFHLTSFALVLSIALAGCVSNAPAPGTGGDTVPTIIHSVQRGEANVFEPATFAVEVGESVTWDVVGEGHHTVTFEKDPNTGGARVDSGDLGPGETWNFTFTKPGTYTYYCRYHSDGTRGMAATVTVTGSGG